MDSNRLDRLVVAATKKNNDTVGRMVEEDGISQITRTIDISEGTVHHILTDRLKLKKLCQVGPPFVDTPPKIQAFKVRQ